MASAATVSATSGPNWSSKWSGMNRVEYPRSSILRAVARQAGAGLGLGQLDSESERGHGPSLGREALRWWGGTSEPPTDAVGARLVAVAARRPAAGVARRGAS